MTEFRYADLAEGRSEGLIEAFRRDGYVVVREFVSADEVAALGAAVDQIHAEGVEHGRPFRHGNLFYNVAPQEAGDPQVRMVQWPSYHNKALDAFRLDPRFFTLLAPLIGKDIKQIINQLHWKAPGAAGDFAWHQDSRFRKPYDAYRNLGDSYVQTGLAIDPHDPLSGGMKFIPRSHAEGDLNLDTGTEVLGSEMKDDLLRGVGLNPDDVIELDLGPGDLALWSPHLVHGSGNNKADHRRRFYINGYVRAEDCDRGEWAFKDGEPVPLGDEPALVHYEQLRENPEPHYPA